MKSFISSSTKLTVLFAITAFACSNDNPNNKIHTRSHSVVFNDRNIEQIREEISKAYNAQDASPPQFIEAARRYELAMAANATGLVNINDKRDKLTCEPFGSMEFYVGSGTLSSSTQILTAHHVVYPRATTTPIRVAFGGQCVDANSCSGKITPLKSAQPPQVENPLLANRLFAMSLHQWAGMSEKDVRDDLRTGWPFKVVDAASQPYMPQSSNGFVGKDTVVLEIAGQKIITKMLNLITGPFTLDRPGLFFGQVDSNPYHKEFAVYFNDRAPVWGTHFPEYDPYNNISDGDYMPVVSEPGYRINEEPNDSCADDNFACVDIAGDGTLSPVAIDYRDCFGTTLDARDGSSGGGVFGLKRVYRGDGNWDGHYEDHVDQFGIFQGVFPSDKTGWDNPIDYVIFPNGVPEAPQFADGDRVTATAIDEAIMRVSQADTPEVIITTPASCGDLDENGDCTWSTFPKLAVIGTIPGDVDRNTQGEVDDVPGIAYEGWSSCGNPENPRHLAVGMLGAATKTFDTPDTRIGSLNLICAPRSCASWSDNWPYLRVISQKTTGKVVAGIEVFADMLMNIPTNPNMLTSWLQEARELREVDGAEQLRPVSYKICPPNYMLNGIQVLSEASENELVGIQTIRCIPVNAQPASPTTSGGYGTTLEFKLWADDDPNIGTYDWAFHHNTNEQFSISPRIGMTDPNGPIQTTSTWLACNGASAIRGFKWARDAQGHLRGLALECGEAPRPPLGPDGKFDESCVPDDK